MAKRSKFEVRRISSPDAPYYGYLDTTLVSSHSSVDVAQRKAAKKEDLVVYAITPWGESRVFPDELWKWGSKEQRAPYGYR